MLSYAGFGQVWATNLFKTSNSFRTLIVENYSSFKLVMKYDRTFLLDFDHTASQNFGLNLKM
jgi:hypothetical protein